MGSNKKHGGGPGGEDGVVIMSTSTSTQIPNQKTGQKTDISREQRSKQANIRQEKLWKVTQKVKFADPVFITSGRYNKRPRGLNVDAFLSL